MLTKEIVRRESRSGDILGILVCFWPNTQRLSEVVSVLRLWLVRQLRRPIETRDKVRQAFALDQDVLP